MNFIITCIRCNSDNVEIGMVRKSHFSGTMIMIKLKCNQCGTEVCIPRKIEDSRPKTKKNRKKK